MSQIYYYNIAQGFEEAIDTIRAKFPNASIPDNADLSILGYAKVITEGSTPTFDPLREGLHYSIKQRPVVGGTEYLKEWHVHPLPDEEIEKNVAEYHANLKKSFADQAQFMLDEFARSAGYDNIVSVCTYAGSPVQKFATEATRAIELRSLMWEKLYEILADVESGNRPIPASFSEIQDELPALVWNNPVG